MSEGPVVIGRAHGDLPGIRKHSVAGGQLPVLGGGFKHLHRLSVYQSGGAARRQSDGDAPVGHGGGLGLVAPYAVHPQPFTQGPDGDAVAAALRQAVHQRDLEGIEGGIYLYRLWSAAVQGIGHAVEHYRIHLGELQHRAERMGVVAMDCASIVPGGGAKQIVAHDLPPAAQGAVGHAEEKQGESVAVRVGKGVFHLNGERRQTHGFQGNRGTTLNVIKGAGTGTLSVNLHGNRLYRLHGNLHVGALLHKAQPELHGVDGGIQLIDSHTVGAGGLRAQRLLFPIAESTCHGHLDGRAVSGRSGLRLDGLVLQSTDREGVHVLEVIRHDK